jgi:hypothetical protein
MGLSMRSHWRSAMRRRSRPSRFRSGNLRSAATRPRSSARTATTIVCSARTSPSPTSPSPVHRQRHPATERVLIDHRTAMHRCQSMSEAATEQPWELRIRYHLEQRLSGLARLCGEAQRERVTLCIWMRPWRARLLPLRLVGRSAARRAPLLCRAWPHLGPHRILVLQWRGQRLAQSDRILLRGLRAGVGGAPASRRLTPAPGRRNFVLEVHSPINLDEAGYAQIHSIAAWRCRSRTSPIVSEVARRNAGTMGLL